jgi:hypothetical protein
MLRQPTAGKKMDLPLAMSVNFMPFVTSGEKIFIGGGIIDIKLRFVGISLIFAFVFAAGGLISIT